jgi:hypothetical protein
MSNVESKIEKLAPREIVADLTVQRMLDQRRANAIAGSLRLDAIGVPVVSRREDGGLFVIDGQHRLEALRIAEHGDRLIEMTVYTGLTIEQEAELFRLFNNTKGLDPLTRFRIALVEKDPETMNIDAIVTRNGYVTVAGKPNSCIAVKTLRGVYHLDGGDTLSRTLAVCEFTWGSQQNATHQIILGALAKMLFRYGHTVNLTRLSDKLRQDPHTARPGAFVGAVRSLAEVNGVPNADAGGGKLVTVYNKNYSDDSPNRLAPWR